MNTSSSGRLNFEFGFRNSAARARREPETPFRLLILADFSGRANRSLTEPLATRRLVRVDIDNLEKVFAGLGAALNLPQGTLKFESLDDFHPDQLLKNVKPLAELHSAIRLLQAPSTAAQSAQALEQLLGAASTPPTNPAQVSTAPAKAESADETMARLMGGAPPMPVAAKPDTSPNLQAMIKNIVGTRDISPAATASQTGLRSAAELELSQRLRSLLHHAEFQALETSWRSLDFLVRRCPDEEQIKLLVLDVTLAELAADFPGLHRLLRDQPPDLLVSNFTFGVTRTDVDTLAALAKLCESLKADFLGAAHAQLVGCDSFAAHPDPDDWKFPAPPEVRDAWNKLRTAPEAASLGLALPRFLLRQPYGPGSETIDSFNFEELAGASNHEAFLWGNSAFLCAQRQAEVWTGGTEESPAGDVGELPVFRYQADDESMVKPCAEAWLTDRAAGVIQRHGLIPCLSIKNRDAVRVVS